MLSSICPKLLCLLLLLLVNGQAGPAYAVDFTASWLYRMTGGEGRDSQDEFQQRYSLGAGTGLTFHPTQAISAGATVGYTRTHRDQGQGMTTVDELTPAAHLGVINDIFLAQLSASTSGFSSDSKLKETSRAWDTTLASRWVIPFWPSLRLNYGEQTEPDINVTNKSRSVGLDWDLLLAQIYYLYSNSKVEGGTGDNLVENDAHFARLESGGRFWDNRVSLNFAQQFQYSTQDFILGTMGGGSFPLQVGGRMTAKVDLATDLNPLNPEDPGYADPEQELPLEADLDERVHLQFITSSGFSEQIDNLRLTLDSSTEARDAVSLIWALYIRMDEFDQWEPLPGTFHGILSDEDENSIEIETGGIEAAEILLVAGNDSGVPLTFIRLEVFSQPTEDFSSSTTSYLTNLGTRIRLTKSLTASTSLTREHFEESGDDTSETDRRSVSGRLRWTPVPFVTPSIGFSEDRREQTGGAETINRSYSLIVSTIPLRTMSVTFGATSYQRFRNEEKTAFGTRYNLTTNALIYPDLNAALFLTYSDDERLASDGLYLSSDGFSSRLNLNARLYRALTANITSSYVQRSRSGAGSTEGADATFSIAYRPSGFLSLRGAYSTSLFGDASGIDRLTLGLTLGLLRTHKTRLTFNANHSQTGSRKSDRFNLDGSWDISRNLSLQTKASYIMGTRSVYSLQGYLTLKL